MKVFKHTSDHKPYGYGHYFYNIPDTDSTECDCAEEIADIMQDAINRHNREEASNILHEIARCIFVSDNPKHTAKIYERAQDMYKTLVKILDDTQNGQFASENELIALLNSIDGKNRDFNYMYPIP